MSTQEEQLHLQAYSKLGISLQCEEMKKEGELLNIKIGQQVILDWVCFVLFLLLLWAL